jgi:glycosyltransferase involved in cell wall biosynthesis
MRIGFVMPAYNEELLLSETVASVVPLVDRLVVVNDGSRDGTGQLADELSTRHAPVVSAIHHPKNRGVGAAVMTGIRALLTEPAVDGIGIISSDKQCDERLIGRFRQVLEQHPDIDVAKGSRFLHRGTLHNMPRFRYWGNRGVSAVMQLILGYRGMSDILHGYLLARRGVFEQMDLDAIAAGYDLENTMMTEFRRIRCRFALIPSPSRYGREVSAIVLHRQIPKTLAKMARIVGGRLTIGPVKDRTSLMLLLASAALLVLGTLTMNPMLALAGLALLGGAFLAMWLTSPIVQRFPGVDDPATGAS